MPRLNGTGPSGRGPMTGRGRGGCRPGMSFKGFRQGRGMRPGFGRGFCRFFGPQRWFSGAALDEREVLEARARFLRKELDYVEKASN